MTTSDRINKYLPEPWGIYSDRGTWLVSKGERWGNPVRVFEDGITLKANGEVKGGKPLDVIAKIEKEREKVRAYSRAFIDTLFAGNMEAPVDSRIRICNECCSPRTRREREKEGKK